MSGVKVAESDADIARCWPVIRQLRAHLKDQAAFVAQAKRQMANDRWRLIYVEDKDAVVAVAGFRILECLYSGLTLYVDDLVTGEDSRSKGHGETLIAWMEKTARDEGCRTFSLDSGVQRSAAHKFYFRMGLPITCYHFAKTL